jgi:hypothetical protein
VKDGDICRAPVMILDEGTLPSLLPVERVTIVYHPGPASDHFRSWMKSSRCDSHGGCLLASSSIFQPAMLAVPGMRLTEVQASLNI